MSGTGPISSYDYQKLKSPYEDDPCLACIHKRDCDAGQDDEHCVAVSGPRDPGGEADRAHAREGDR